MKKFLLTAFIAAAAIFTGCQSSDLYSDLPGPVAHFVSQYWPNPAIAAYSPTSGGGCSVTVENGPTIEFDSEYGWTKISGNGMPLPETLLYNVLPQALYRYLESAEQTGQVFSIDRTAQEYHLRLLNTSLTYDIATGLVKG